MKITVRKDIYEAGLKLTRSELNRPGIYTDWNLAEILVDVFREIRLDEEANFWSDVRLHLMEMEFLDSEVEIELTQIHQQ